jgi:hypothetical protein
VQPITHKLYILIYEIKWFVNFSNLKERV